MSVFRISISTDNRAVQADPAAPLGPAADGAVVHEVTDCPPQARVEDAIYLLQGGSLPAATYSHVFGDLSARRSSCCGTCGG